MQSNNYKAIATLLALCLLSSPLWALQSDRQQPLDLKAGSLGGSLADGESTFTDGVVIEQGSLYIASQTATITKVQGRIQKVIFVGQPATLSQEIENLGKVDARANRIEYSVARGEVVLMGNARVDHPEYEISGEELKYDLDEQNFQGSGRADGNNRIHVRLEPEIAEPDNTDPAAEDSQDDDTSSNPDSQEQESTSEEEQNSSGESP